MVPATSLPKSMPRTELTGLNIVVTRPAHQADHLCHLIEAAGGRAIRLPVLTITPTTTAPSVTEIVAHLTDYDMALFISPNAVHFAAEAVGDAGLPATLTLAAVGKGTARALRDTFGRTPELLPAEQFNSEGLLALPAMQQVAGRRIVIFRGNGGRELLADTLRSRGADVDYAEVYRREAAAGLAADDDRLQDPDIIVVTSSEGVSALVAMTPQPLRQRLFSTPLLLVSERAVQQARELGFQALCRVTPQAADDAIVDSLMAWAAERPTTMEQ